MHATTFGGCPHYDLITPDDELPKLADTMVLSFGEQKTQIAMFWVVCSLTIKQLVLIDMHLSPIDFLIVVQPPVSCYMWHSY